jgi:hypothetical protein
MKSAVVDSLSFVNGLGIWISFSIAISIATFFPP